jgi:hypothetical protein
MVYKTKTGNIEKIIQFVVGLHFARLRGAKSCVADCHLP